jgi:hypothetical protein
MPKHSSDILELPHEVFATGGEERTDLAGPSGQCGPASVWTPRLTPILTLLQELLADLFAVRDQAPQAWGRRGRGARALIRQYEQDLQWLSSPEERAPFSFGWVCQALGLEAAAVRRRYLSGQPVALPRRHLVGITSGHLRLERTHRRGGKVRALRGRQKVPLNGQGHEGNGTEPVPQGQE